MSVDGGGPLANLTGWTRQLAATFLDVAPQDFDALAASYGLLEVAPGRFRAVDVAGLAETIAYATPPRGPEWCRSHARDGFASIPNMIGSHDLDDLSTWAREKLAAGDDQADGVNALRSPEGGIVRVNYLDRDPESLSLFRRLPLAEEAARIVTDAVLYRLSIVVRSYTVPPEIGRHRDPRWSSRVTSTPVFAFGIHLEATRGEAGDVYYVPTSHRLADTGMVVDVDAPALEEVTPATEPGDVVVHNLGVLHGAHRYRRAHKRVTVYASFASAREVAASSWGPPRVVR